MSSPCDPRFNVLHPNLCLALRWKGQFVVSELGEVAQPQHDTGFWCMYTQTCIGPDGTIARPDVCSSPIRECHGSGKCG